MEDDSALGFGRFVLFPQRRELLCDTVPVPLGPRALDILLHLVANRATIVGKDALLRFVWPRRTVEENNLTVHMSALRRALGDGQGGVRFIQTVAGRGYRFVAPVHRVEPTTSAAARGSAVPEADATTPPASNLPQPATRFVGRDGEMAEIKRRLTLHRLVTITGIGGIGKTRIAAQVGSDLLPRYRDGVWLVDLSPVSDPALVVETIAAVFHLGGEASSLERLIGYLANQRLLIILDSCEHLISRCAELARAILLGCPGVALLATSRESLAIDGESLYRLPPLPFPDHEQPIDAATALRHDAVRLFNDRATAMIAGFVLDDTTARDVARICSRLDGIALAIEMAVPRLQVLNPAQLADRLNERFRLLSTHSRAALPRHRTLRAVLDWSHELLSEAEKLLFRRLAVFAGSANLEAVVAVATEHAPDDWDVLDLLTALVDKSLVVAEVTGREPRYRLLETTRQYALEKLAAGDEAWCRRAHAAHFAEMFERAEAEWPTTPTAAWLELYGSDTDNLRAALEWAFGPDGDAALGLRLTASSYPLWWDLPYLPLQESRRWFDLAMRHVTAETPARIAARLWFGTSWRDVRFGDRENFPAAERAVALFRQVGEPIGLGAALWRAGSALLTAETADAARAYFDEAEQVLRAQPPTKWLALCLVKQGDLRFRLGNARSALAAYEEAMQLSRSTAYWYGLMNGGSNMSELLLFLGQQERALTQLRQLRADLLPGRSTPLVATLAAHLLIAGEVEEARAAVRETITFARAIGLVGALGWAIEVLALILAEAGQGAQAARFLGYALVVHPSVETRQGGYREVYRRVDAVLSETLLPADRQRLIEEGAGWTQSEAADHAAAACGAAYVSGP
jgi:predicted ATPase/DNA-binding winged helix-turn-helix (wHTH) protein